LFANVASWLLAALQGLASARPNYRSDRTFGRRRAHWLEEAVVQPALGWIDDAGAKAWDGPATADRTVAFDPRA
jgi:hypothetical protein